MQRAGSSRVHDLTPDMPTQSRQVTLSVTRNKMQLSGMLADSLLSPDFYTDATQKHGLILAGVTNVPIEIVNGMRIDRQDLRSSHEEADTIITQHAIATSMQNKSVCVVCDDTDVFV